MSFTRRSKYSTFTESNSILKICNDLKFEPKHIVEAGVGGPIACRASEFISDNCKIDLFEANPIFYKMLVDGLSKCPNVSIYNIGLFNKNGTMQFYDRGASGFISGINSPYNQNGGKDFASSINIQTDTFDKYDDGTVDCLMADVEGAEWFIIECMKSRPKLIILEMFGGRAYINPFNKEISNWMQLNKYKEVLKDESDICFLKNE